MGNDMGESTHTADDNGGGTPGLSRRTALTAVAATALAGAVAPGIATAGPHRPDLEGAIRVFVDAGFAGMQMRVRDERGEWVGSTGVRELGRTAEPPTDGLFRVGSTTKTFVATVVLHLVAEGRIGLDDPVADRLPRFGLDPRITVRMLLQHSSGVFNFTGEHYEDGTVVPGIPWQGQEWVDRQFHTYPPDDLVRLALSKPPRFAPGAGWSYSNTNYVLAALLIEQITGRPYGEEVRRLILRPLGLRGTSVPGTSPELPGPHAHGYHRYEVDGGWKTVDVSRQNPSWASGAGEMISTTRDLATFFSALNGGELLPAPLLAEMRRPHPDSGAHHYGLGVFVQDLGPGGGTILHHNGSVLGYGALMISTPDGRKTLTASITTGDAEDNPVLRFKELLDGLVETVFGGRVAE
ncbi:serine hydrolase domain-containing protein [Umezawaea endophytica]